VKLPRFRPRAGAGVDYDPVMRNPPASFVVFALLLPMVSGPALAQDGDWIALFDGATLDGWTQHNGTATYRVEDGAIVGRTTPGSPNAFLCTERFFEDFELRFEVKVDDRLNSGVQIRSRTADGTTEGRVHGPQVEIEASGEKGAEAGYLYAEAIAGWRSSSLTRPSATASGTRTE
jgi:hypothetical protein